MLRSQRLYQPARDSVLLMVRSTRSGRAAAADGPSPAPRSARIRGSGPQPAGRPQSAAASASGFDARRHDKSWVTAGGSWSSGSPDSVTAAGGLGAGDQALAVEQPGHGEAGQGVDHQQAAG